ncbi:natriuretic peptides A [Urocitellus parryii]
MGSFSAVAVSLLLFLLFQLPGQAGAKPVYSAVSSADLADFKNLLDRLEEKMPLESEVPSRVRGEQNEEAGPDVPDEASWTGEVSPDQGDGAGPGPDPWDSADRSAFLRNKPTAPRSLPRSSCFGGRMDRIGAHSGLGCNSFRSQIAKPNVFLFVVRKITAWPGRLQETLNQGSHQVWSHRIATESG